MFHRNCGCNGTRHVTCCPPNVMPTQYAPAQVSPTHEVVRTNILIRSNHISTQLISEM
ncbi:hypothetical protein UACE39S_05213 [Ureibacillus acetophenoni]